MTNVFIMWYKISPSPHRRGERGEMCERKGGEGGEREREGGGEGEGGCIGLQLKSAPCPVPNLEKKPM